MAPTGRLGVWESLMVLIGCNAIVACPRSLRVVGEGGPEKHGARFLPTPEANATRVLRRRDQHASVSHAASLAASPPHARPRWRAAGFPISVWPPSLSLCSSFWSRSLVLRNLARRHPGANTSTSLDTPTARKYIIEPPILQREVDACICCATPDPSSFRGGQALFLPPSIQCPFLLQPMPHYCTSFDPLFFFQFEISATNDN